MPACMCIFHFNWWLRFQRLSSFMCISRSVYGAIVGSAVSTVFNVWIVIGNFLTSPHKHWLTTTTAACNGCSTSTTAILNSTGLDDVYVRVQGCK